MKFVLSLILMIPVLCSHGCMMMEVGVTNPIPQMRRIAIVPFINLSSEQAVDGRRVADYYYSELQKTPGFQVLPVGVTDSALHDLQLNLDNPSDLPKLAAKLDVDAIVIGAVTEYSPYYPPKLGLQISWYTTEQFEFVPGIPIDPHLRDLEDAEFKAQRKTSRWFARGQSPTQEQPPLPQSTATSPQYYNQSPNYNQIPAQPPSIPPQITPPQNTSPSHQLLPPPLFPGNIPQGMNPHGYNPSMENSPEQIYTENHNNIPAQPVYPPDTQPYQHEQSYPDSSTGKPNNTRKTPEPVMSYTRIFDGSDAKLVANLRDFVELSGDQRSGGWEGYLQRSDDFIRFCSHRMIVEMLQLHGGETYRRVVFAKRRFK